jgi:hypothetical protein
MLTILNRYGLQKLLAYSTGLVDQELRRNKYPVPENVILPIGQPRGCRTLSRSSSQS